MKEYYIQEGQLFTYNDKTTKKKFGLFSINKLIKRLLKAYNVPFIDDCCTPAVTGEPFADTTSLPVRYNADEDQLERYDPDTDSWVAVS